MVIEHEVNARVFRLSVHHTSESRSNLLNVHQGAIV